MHGAELPRTRGELFLRPIGDRVEQRYAVSLGSQSDLAGAAEGGVLHLEQTFAIVNDPEAPTCKLHTKTVPHIGWDPNRDPVAALAADDVERAADPVDGLVEHNVVLERVGTDHVIVVGVPGAPDQPARAILGSGNRLELRLDKTVLDIGVSSFNSSG